MSRLPIAALEPFTLVGKGKTDLLVAAVNQRAKNVVGQCGAKRGSWLDRGGYACKTGYVAPTIDFLPGKQELPTLEAVCPVD